MTKAQIGQMHALLHRLWTNNVGQPGYNKRDWMELQWLLTLLHQETIFHEARNVLFTVVAVVVPNYICPAYSVREYAYV